MCKVRVILVDFDIHRIFLQAAIIVEESLFLCKW